MHWEKDCFQTYEFFRILCLKKILYLHDCTFRLNSTLPSFKCWFTRLSSVKDLKMILHERQVLGVFFFTLIWFSKWLICTNYVGLIFRRGGWNFIVEELVCLNTFQKKSSNLLQNCVRRCYIWLYRIKPFFRFAEQFPCDTISKWKMSHW